MPPASTLDISAIVDLDRYPLDQPGSAGYRAALDAIQGDLDAFGCGVLKGFVRPEILAAMVEEADRVAPLAHRSFGRTNAYFTQDRDDLPESHPLRRFYDRSNAFVPADNFGADSPLRAIYAWPPFADFIGTALRQQAFFPYADPLADVIINLTEEGAGFPWHFDTNNFTVTLAIQNGEAGGEFEYVPALRTAEDEHYEAVQAVLDDRSDRVRTLVLEPGDLQLFKGRYALHRVRPVEGATRRYVAIFSFVEKEGMVGSPERTRQLYGRVLPIHLERAGHRDDALID